jgi:predicted small secreted protein
MKFVFVILILAICVAVAGCGTVGGTLAGAGDDLKKAGEWVKSK